MNLSERIQLLIAALPSDGSSVTFTRADLAALVEAPEGASLPRPERDLSVEEVAEEVGRAPSTVRGWLIHGELKGYKLNGRDWRVTRAALRAYLTAQRGETELSEPEGADSVDISAWRKVVQ